MGRLTARRARLGLLLAALVLPLAGLAAAPAHADDPIPTKVFVQFYGDGDHAGQTIEVIAHIRPADGGPEYPSGSVVFSMGDPNPVPVDPHYLTARTTITIPSNDPFTVTATFTGTDGWGDSAASGTFTPLTRRFFDPEPTLARLGSGGLKLSLTFATHLRNSLGAGVPGREIDFSLLGPVPSIGNPNSGYVHVCTAVTDANGLASCKGSATLAALVSILTNGAYATLVNGVYTGFEWVHLPVLLTS